MKKAEDYIKLLKWSVTTKDDTIQGMLLERVWYEKSNVEALIKQAQIDAIEATVLKCSQEAKTKMVSPETYGDKFGDSRIIVDEQSILKVAEQLKKELE